MWWPAKRNPYHWIYSLVGDNSQRSYQLRPNYTIRCAEHTCMVMYLQQVYRCCCDNWCQLQLRDYAETQMQQHHVHKHRAHLGPTGPRWAPWWPHKLCFLGCTNLLPMARNMHSRLRCSLLRFCIQHLLGILDYRRWSNRILYYCSKIYFEYICCQHVFSVRLRYILTTDLLSGLFWVCFLLENTGHHLIS